MLIEIDIQTSFPSLPGHALETMAERSLGMEPSAYSVSSQCLVDYS